MGDKVIFTADSTYGVIDDVCERQNELSRPLIANIDKLFIVSAHSVPAPDPLMLDRLTAACEFKKIEPIIVFNKCDMGSFADVESIYKTTPYKVFTVSALTGQGISDLKNEIHNSVCAFAGNSGVGKSSIINALFKNLFLKTGEVSVKLGRGRHTTRHTELFPTDNGGFVADTPGFSSFDGEVNSYEFKKSLFSCFPEFLQFSDNCRFSDCTHTCEKGCAVIEAVNNGLISESRHSSYVKLFDELKEVKEWNTANKK